VGETYAGAGVDIEAGDRAVAAIGRAVASTHDRPGVVGSLGGFGGLFKAPTEGYDDPLLVAATDGVGTKIQIARALDRWDTIGRDLVAMCVDDLACQGAEPLFFLDYISTGLVVPERIADIVGGVAEGCRLAGAALIGGETAEHPGVMDDDDVDLVGFAVGIVDRARLVDHSKVEVGDSVIGLASPNLRSNGYSLARRVLFERLELSLDDPAWPGADTSVGDELLSPSVIYSPHLAALTAEVEVRSIAHITGGGMVGNINRAIPDSCDALIDASTWPEPPIFDVIRRGGEVEDAEMRRVFNMGIGMTVVVPAAEEAAGIAALSNSGVEAFPIGRIIEGSGAVLVET